MIDDDDRTNEERKERVLHTRVPAVLEQELKRLASSFRLPVSNLVRTILEDAVDTIDSVGGRAESELRDAADRVRQRRDGLRRPTSQQRDASTYAHETHSRDARVSEPSHEQDVRTAAPLAGVVGYQPLWVARDETCSLCGAPIARGRRGFLAVREHAGPRVLLDERCLPFAARDLEGEHDDEQPTHDDE